MIEGSLDEEHAPGISRGIIINPFSPLATAFPFAIPKRIDGETLQDLLCKLSVHLSTVHCPKNMNKLWSN